MKITKTRLLLLILIAFLTLLLVAAGPPTQGGVGFRGWVSCITVDDSSPCIYALGREISLDADEDTSITADTDDQIDYELGGDDIFVMKEWGSSNVTTNTTEYLLEILDTTNVMTAGTNSLAALNIDLGIGNSTGGTNNIYGILIDAISGDAQNTETALSIGSGWDVGFASSAAANFTYVQDADSGATGDSVEVAFTSPVDTTGTNTHNGLTIDLAIGNATGGTNNVRAIQIDAITDDPQVVETAINIGDEWDIAIDTGLPIVATAVTWMDDFLGDTVLGQYTEINGADGQAVQAIQEEQFGAYSITSGDVGDTDANDLEATYLSLEWQADQGALIFETRLHLDTDVTTTQLCAGFTDDVSTVEVAFTIAGSDVVTAVADDAVMFCFDTRADTDEWFALGVANTTAATGNGATGTAPVADTYQTLRIEIDDGGADCRFYIDGTLVKTITANCITVTDLLAPGFVISSADTADSNTVDIDYMFVAAARD